MGESTTYFVATSFDGIIGGSGKTDKENSLRPDRDSVLVSSDWTIVLLDRSALVESFSPEKIWDCVDSFLRAAILRSISLRWRKSSSNDEILGCFSSFVLGWGSEWFISM